MLPVKERALPTRPTPPRESVSASAVAPRRECYSADSRIIFNGSATNNLLDEVDVDEVCEGIQLRAATACNNDVPFDRRRRRACAAVSGINDSLPPQHRSNSGRARAADGCNVFSGRIAADVPEGPRRLNITAPVPPVERVRVGAKQHVPTVFGNAAPASIAPREREAFKDVCNTRPTSRNSSHFYSYNSSHHMSASESTSASEYALSSFRRKSGRGGCDVFGEKAQGRQSFSSVEDFEEQGVGKPLGNSAPDELRVTTPLPCRPKRSATRGRELEAAAPREWLCSEVFSEKPRPPCGPASSSCSSSSYESRREALLRLQESVQRRSRDCRSKRPSLERFKRDAGLLSAHEPGFRGRRAQAAPSKWVDIDNDEEDSSDAWSDGHAAFSRRYRAGGQASFPPPRRARGPGVPLPPMRRHRGGGYSSEHPAPRGFMGEGGRQPRPRAKRTDRRSPLRADRRSPLRGDRRSPSFVAVAGNLPAGTLVPAAAPPGSGKGAAGARPSQLARSEAYSPSDVRVAFWAEGEQPGAAAEACRPAGPACLPAASAGLPAFTFMRTAESRFYWSKVAVWVTLIGLLLGGAVGLGAAFVSYLKVEDGSAVYRATRGGQLSYANPVPVAFI